MTQPSLRIATRLALGILTLAPTTAAAAPACLRADAGVELRAVEARLVICQGHGPECIDVEARRAVARPAPTATWRTAKQKTQVCLGERCRQAGKRLAARLAKLARQRAVYARENPDHAVDGAFGLTLASDLGRAVLVADISETELWDVARDRRIVPRAPSEYAAAAADATPELAWLTLAGDAVVARWSTCMGVRVDDCARSAIVGADGSHLPGLLPDGRAVGLAGNRVALVPSDQRGELTVVDGATAAVIATIPYDRDRVRDADAVALGPDELAIVWRAGSRWRVTRVQLPANAPPTVAPPRALDTCR